MQRPSRGAGAPQKKAELVPSLCCCSWSPAPSGFWAPRGYPRNRISSGGSKRCREAGCGLGASQLGAVGTPPGNCTPRGTASAPPRAGWSGVCTPGAGVSGDAGAQRGRRAGRGGAGGALPEKKWALKPFLETVLSDLNSILMLLYWEVMTSGFSAPQNLPWSLESAVSPLRTSTKSYLQTYGGRIWGGGKKKRRKNGGHGAGGVPVPPSHPPRPARGAQRAWGPPQGSLTSLPSVSKKSNCSEMRYWVGATSCQMQFLLGGYSLGHPGLVMEPFSLVRNPPQAAAGREARVTLPARVLGGTGRHWGGGTLTLTAAFVGGQLVAGVAGAFVAPQGVDAALLAPPVVRPRALVHLWARGRGLSGWARLTPPPPFLGSPHLVWAPTFEEIDGEAGFVDGAVGDEFHPELVGGALDVVRLVVATVAADQAAGLAAAVPDLQVVVGAAVVALDLGGRGAPGCRFLGTLRPQNALPPPDDLRVSPTPFPHPGAARKGSSAWGN